MEIADTVQVQPDEQLIEETVAAEDSIKSEESIKVERRSRRKAKKTRRLPGVFSLVYFVVTFIYLEIIFHNKAFDNYSVTFPVLFAIPSGIFAGMICNLFPEKIARILRYVISAGLMLLFCVQIVYVHSFRSFMCLSQVGMGGDVFSNFYKIIFLAIWECRGPILLTFLPLVGLYFLQRHMSVKRKFDWRKSLISACVWVVTYMLVILMLPLAGRGSHSAYANFHKNWVLDLSMEKLGVLTTTGIDLKLMLFGDFLGAGGGDLARPVYQKPPDDGEQHETSGETIPLEGEESIYNVIEGLDFQALITDDMDDDTKAVFEYLSLLEPTKKNQYTGMFEGYNLILITAESFSSMAIHPEATPTLYKLANSGFDFTNYWTMYPSNTTNGEYSNLTGLMPDTSKPKANGSFVNSTNNTMNMNIAHYFNALGVTSRGYHDHTATYYKRNETHPNLGYVFEGKKEIGGLTGWPESDLVMMQNTIEDYINEDLFHTYYMTVSGHHNYRFGGYNDMADKNEDVVKDLDMGKNAKAYLATNVELDRAVEFLIQELEKAGKLDKTVICITTDHYPYGLTDREWKEMIGHGIRYGGMERYQSDLIIWNSAMETVKIDKPACQVDVLPTLLNLFGFEYDSRLYSGCDILSDSYGLAIMTNQSFVTEKIVYNTRYEKVYYLDEDWVMPEGYLESYIQIVKNRYSVSSNILNSDLYALIPADLVEAAQKGKN